MLTPLPEPTDTDAMTFRQFLAVVEIRTKVVSVSTTLLASLYVVHRTGRLDPLRAALMFAATLLIDMGTTGFNTVFDFSHGVDSARFNREESKVLVHEGVPWGRALLVSVSLFVLALPLGLVLAWLSGWPLLAAGAACMAIGYFYAGGPLPISRTPLGELFAGGTLGTVLFLIVWYVQAGWPDVRALVAALPSGFCIAAILTVNNTCDIDGDRAAGRRTISVVAGRKAGESLAVLEVVLAFGLLAVVARLESMNPWTLLVLPPALVLVAAILTGLHRRGFRHATKGAAMGDISRILGVFTMTMTLMLVLDLLLRP